MGGGDLNLKKSWHPNTLKNQEKVWKAEQQKKDEDNKIEEMRREIHEERMKEELMNVAHKSGVIEEESDKLKWMYKSPAEQTSREEYLLGRKVDKTLEMIDDHETTQNKNEAISSKPVYVIEHEVAPEAFLRRTDDFQVDLQRKILEDPLYEIRQKEAAAKAAVTSNPVKMKNIQDLLESVKVNSSKKKKKKSDKKKKHKKEKKRKKKKKAVSSSSSDSEASEDDHPKKKKSKRKLKLTHDHKLHKKRERRTSESKFSSTHSSRKTNHRRQHRSPVPERSDKGGRSEEGSKKRKRSEERSKKYRRSEERSNKMKMLPERSPNVDRTSSKNKRDRDNPNTSMHERYSSYLERDESHSDNDMKYSKSKVTRDESLSDNDKEYSIDKHTSRRLLSSEMERKYSKDRREIERYAENQRHSKVNRDASTSDRLHSSSKRKRYRTESPSDNEQRGNKSSRSNERSRLERPEHMERSPLETVHKSLKNKSSRYSPSDRKLSKNREGGLSSPQNRHSSLKMRSSSAERDASTTGEDSSDSDRSSSSSAEEVKRKKVNPTTAQRTQAEMMRLRSMMMEAAKKRDIERKQNIENYRKEEIIELEEEKKPKGALRVISSSSLDGSVESSIRSRAGKCQKERDMDSNFLRK